MAAKKSVHAQEWTEELLVRAGQQYFKDYGEVPTQIHFYPKAAERSKRPDKEVLIKRFVDDACWPSSATVIKKFRSFGAYQKACGFEPTRASGGAAEKINRLLQRIESRTDR